VGKAGAFDDLTDEELVALAARKARELAFAGPREVEDDNNNKKSPQADQFALHAGLADPPWDVRFCGRYWG
jgi:hypothetical protein